MFVGIGVGVGRQRVSGRSAAFDSDYQAVLTYATSLGYTLPSSAQQIKQNQLMLDLKAAGVWSKLDTFAMFANDGGSNFGLIDWKRLSLYTAVNSPTFTSNQGFQGNGTSSYIDTNFNPATQGVNYTLNNASRYIYSRINAANRVYDGVANSTANSITAFDSALHRINQGGNNLSTTFALGGSTGVKSIHRTSSTSVTLYNAKSASSGLTATSTATTNENQLILRSATSCTAHQISAYAMGASLVSENTSFVDAFDTYITSL